MEHYRSYCACCSNYRVVHRFAGAHYCGRCKRSIATRLEKRNVDYLDTVQVERAVDEIVAEIEKTMEGEKRMLERDYRKKIRPGKRISEQEW